MTDLASRSNEAFTEQLSEAIYKMTYNDSNLEETIKRLGLTEHQATAAVKAYQQLYPNQESAIELVCRSFALGLALMYEMMKPLPTELDLGEIPSDK